MAACYICGMQTSLRKMGNSTGMIVPRSILGQIGVTTGATMDLSVVDGKLVASPVSTPRRAGWAAAADAIAQAGDDDDGWRDFANEGDVDLAW